jgi:Uma2 family endonuclease
VSSTGPARPLAIAGDLVAMDHDDGSREIIDGEIVQKAVPSPEHGSAPERPRDRPVKLRPDWVCEILSASNASNDTVRKLRALHRAGVPNYWLLDPERLTLTVLRWTAEGYLEALTATAQETVRAEPFDAIELELAVIFGN